MVALAARLFLWTWFACWQGSIARKACGAQRLNPPNCGVLLLAVFLHRFGLVGVALFIRHLYLSVRLYAVPRSRAMTKMAVAICAQLRYAPHMADQETLTEENIGSLRRDRELLLDQIRRSQETITRSQQLVKRIDELLAKVEQNKTQPKRSAR